MKWIGKGTLRISNKLTLFYGDDIPKGFPKERLKALQKQGKIGDIIEKISEHPEIRALNEQIRRRDQKIEALEKQVKALKITASEITEAKNQALLELEELKSAGDDK